MFGISILQKRLEEDPMYLNVIFDDILSHVAEILMEYVVATRSFDAFRVLIIWCKTSHWPLVQKYLFIMYSTFGNYLFQKIIEISSAEQQLSLAQAISTVAVTASLDLRGSRALQQFIDVARTPEVVRDH